MAAYNDITPTTQILDASGNDWAWAFVIHRPIPGHFGYTIGTNRTIWTFWNCHSQIRDRPVRLSGHLDRDGYRKFHLKKTSGGNKFCSMHCLMLETFVGPCPPGLVCRHLDGDPANNDLSNLKWGTHAENINDRDAVHMTTARGTMQPNALLREEDIGVIYDLYDSGWNIRDIAKRFSVSPSACSSVLKGKIWTHAVPGRVAPLKGVNACSDLVRRWSKTMKHITGESHHTSKLTLVQAKEIRRLYSTGNHTYKSIGCMFGVKQNCIRQIVVNETYIE